MKIDQDDIPEYIRARKPSPWGKLLAAVKWSIAGIFGLGVTGGALYLADDLAQLAQAVRINGNPIITQPSPAPATPVPAYDEYDAQVARALAASDAQKAPTAKIEWEQVEEPAHQAPAPKQTSFSDQNYRPRTVNTYTPPPSQQIAYNQPAKPKQAPQRFTLSDTWRWENGYEKKPTGGRFQWVEVDGAIEWGSVCQNYQKGSLIYRDCRKGAKVAFKNMCNSYKPACRAENGFMP
jgi:hypothetical protein